MRKIIDKLYREPAVLVGTVFAFIAYFGVVVPADKMSQITEVATVLGPIIAGFITRHFVSPAVPAAPYLPPAPPIVNDPFDPAAPHGENPERRG